MTLICNSCPNGCELTLTASPKGTVVEGNFCPKGIAYAVKHTTGFPAPFRQKQNAISLDEANRVLTHWNLVATAIRGSSLIQGSPERSLRRTVISTDSGSYILEQIDPNKAAFRETVANLLASLSSNVPVIPYSFAADTKAVQKEADSFWMVHPFVFHTELNRETFWESEELGRTVGNLLVSLAQLPTTDSLPRYSPKSYFEKLILSIGKTRIDVRKAIVPILGYLKSTILPEIESLPLAFSHGDAHPLNMLWNENKLLALIDWEFCGIRPRIYDTALVIGCVATESPQAIDAGFVKAIIDSTKRIFTVQEQNLLAPMIVLNRFNWLSEWLRRHDEEMIRFEIEYMKSLINRFQSE